MFKRFLMMILVLLPSLALPINGEGIAQTGMRVVDCPEVETFGQWDYVEVEPIQPVAQATRISRRYVIAQYLQAYFSEQIGEQVEGEDYLQGTYIAGIWGKTGRLFEGSILETWTVWYWQGDYYVAHESGCVVSFEVILILHDWDDEIRALYGSN